MDRDKRWDRVKLAWDAIVLGKGEAKTILASEAVADCYATLQKTDEFLPPMIFCEANQHRDRDGDVILFFNFRADRARELSDAFLNDGFDGFDREFHPKVRTVRHDVCYKTLGTLKNPDIPAHYRSGKVDSQRI